MPVPYVIESACCVSRDSLIICVGGSMSGFQQATSIIRSYNPFTDVWVNSLSVYPITATTAHAECYTDTIGVNDSLVTYIVVLGGYGAVIDDLVYRGVVGSAPDTLGQQILSISWINRDFSPFPGGVYRVSGGMWNKMPIFGPGVQDTTTMGQIYGLSYVDSDSLFHWLQLLPDIIDTNSNIPQIAISPGQDSTHFYFFGGTRNLKFSNQVKEYSVAGQPPPPIGIRQVSHSVPKQFLLYQNYPNPFNPSTVIRFQVTSSKLVKLKIYDILGRVVATLVNEQLMPGTYSFRWDAVNYASGIYFYALESGDFKSIKKMVLIK